MPSRSREHWLTRLSSLPHTAVGPKPSTVFSKPLMKQWGVAV